jgi:hypothetical protein
MEWWKRFLNVLLVPDNGTGGGGAGGDGGQGGEGAGEASAAGGEPRLPKFASQISPEIKTRYAKDLEGYADKGLNEIVSDLFDTRSQLARAIIPPDPKTGTPEEIAAFRKKINVPDTADGYQIDASAFKDLEGVDEVVKTLKEKAFAKSLNQKQAQGYVEDMLGFGKAAKEARTAAEKDAREKFDDRLGASIDPEKKLPAEKLKGEVEGTKNLLMAFFVKTLKDPELVKDAAARGIFHDVRWARAFAGLQTLLGDETFIRGRTQGNGEGVSKRGAMGSYSEDFASRYS